MDGITSYVKSIVHAAIQEDILIKSGPDIFPASSAVLKALTFFKNIFVDCELPLHEGKSLITLEGFHFLNKRNIQNLHAYIRSRMLFDPKGPSTLFDQINFLLLLDYFIGENSTERCVFIAEIWFVPEFWTEILDHPKILSFFPESRVLRDLMIGKDKISADVREKIHKAYGMKVFTVIEMYEIYPCRSSYPYFYNISNHTMYYVCGINYSERLVKLVECEKLSPMIKYDTSTKTFCEDSDVAKEHARNEFICNSNGLLHQSIYKFVRITDIPDLLRWRKLCRIFQTMSTP